MANSNPKEVAAQMEKDRDVKEAYPKGSRVRARIKSKATKAIAVSEWCPEGWNVDFVHVYDSNTVSIWFKEGDS